MSQEKTLLAIVRELSFARSLDAITRVVAAAARASTGADGVTFILRDGEHCVFVDENAIAPLWKGQRLPLADCLCGRVILTGETAVVPDVYADAGIPDHFYRPTVVHSLAILPIRSSAPIGAIGAYWSVKHVATAPEIEALQAIADAAALALANVELNRSLALSAAREREHRLAAEATARHVADEGRRWDATFNAVAHAIAILDRTGRIVRCNRAYAAIVGRPATELAGVEAVRPLLADTKPGRPTDGWPFERAAATCEEQRLELQHGELWFEILCTPILDDAGDFSGTVRTLFEFTERRHAADALRRSEARYRALFEQNAVAIATSDTHGRLLSANPGFCRMLGYDEAELREASFAKITHPEDIALSREAGARLRELGGLEELEKRYVRRDGSILWGHSKISLVDDGVTEPYNIVAVQDVTRRHVLDEQLRLADKRKDEFLGILAHELRNPLAAIQTAADLLQRLGDVNELASTTRERIERQVRHLVRLVDDLLDVSRITRGVVQLHMEEVDLAAVIRSAVEATQAQLEARGHDLLLAFTGRRAIVHGDTVRLQQVIGNLLHNAARYTPEGGHIVVELGAEGEVAVVRVRDDGIGMEADLQPRVFDLFTRGDTSITTSGLGVGLALVRQLVGMHGGTVAASSEGLGHGSTFEVRLPLRTPAHPPAAPVENAERPLPLRRLSVLVVDDNRDSAEALALLLELDGYRVRTAHDGAEALRLVPQLRPDVVLLDIGLPDTNGYEVGRLLRAAPGGESLALVAFTGYGQDEDRERSREAGFDAHLVKPVATQEIERVLQRIVAGRSAPLAT